MMMVIAAITTTNSYGKQLATKSPAAKDTAQDALPCLIIITSDLFYVRLCDVLQFFDSLQKPSAKIADGLTQLI